MKKKTDKKKESHLGTIVSSGWYHDSLAFGRSLGSSAATSVERTAGDEAAQRVSGKTDGTERDGAAAAEAANDGELPPAFAAASAFLRASSALTAS